MMSILGQEPVDIMGTVGERSPTYTAAFRAVLTDLSIMKKLPLTRVLRIV
jgi:hypothetical protein